MCKLNNIHAENIINYIRRINNTTKIYTVNKPVDLNKESSILDLLEALVNYLKENDLLYCEIRENESLAKYLLGSFFHDRDTKLYEYFTLINAPLTAHPLHDSCGYSHGYEFLNSPDLMAYDDNSGIFINRNNYTFELKFRCTFCREIDSPPSWCKLH